MGTGGPVCNAFRAPPWPIKPVASSPGRHPTQPGIDLARFWISCSRERQRVDETSARWRSQLLSCSRLQFNLNRSSSQPADILHEPAKTPRSPPSPQESTPHARRLRRCTSSLRASHRNTAGRSSAASPRLQDTRSVHAGERAAARRSPSPDGTRQTTSAIRAPGF